MSRDVIILRDSTDPSKTTTLRAGDPISGLILSKTVTLTDAQIKTLPTIPVEIVPAPGPGKVILPIGGFYLADVSVAYTGQDVSGPHLVLGPEGTGPDAGGVATGYAWVSFLRQGPRRFGQILPAASLDAPTSNVNANYFWSNVDADLVNMAIQLYSDNSIDFAGGDAGNTLKVTLYYTIVDV